MNMKWLPVFRKPFLSLVQVHGQQDSYTL